MADDLLDDLNDLGSDLEEEDETIDVRPAGSSHWNTGPASASGVDVNDAENGGDDSDSDDEDENVDTGVDAGSAASAQIKAAADEELNAQLASLAGRSGLRSVARLRETKRFQDHMRRVAEALTAPSIPSVVGPLEEWPEYRLILSCNALVTALDEEQHDVHRFLADAWAKRFPELDSIVPSRLEYARVVKLTQNEADLTKVDFSGLLSSAAVMVITVTGSTTQGKALPEPALKEALAAADELLALEDAKQSILSFIESRMEYLAPNVSALLGTRVAAQLLGVAGGLQSLSRTPACNVQVIGQKKKHAAGFARSTLQAHAGLIYDSPVVMSAPSSLRRKTAKVLAAKVVLAARVDAFRESGEGDTGRALRGQVEAKLAKWQEPPPARQKKPLKAPDDRPSKRRGGRRYRAMKERLGMTDVRKEANRLAMTGGGDFDSVAMGTDTGMLNTGSSATGRLRVEKRAGQSAKVLGLAGLAKRRKLGVGQGGGVGGTLSSFAFTPVQGIELVNPDAARRAKTNGTSTSVGAGGAASSVSAALNLGGGTGGSYFDHSGTFTMVRPGK